MSPEEESALRQRLADLESLLEALQNHEVDAVVGKEHVLLLRLKDFEEQYSSLLENLPDAVFRLDPELRYLYVSPVIKLYVDKDPRSLLGQTASEAGMPDEEWRCFAECSREVFESGEPRQLGFYRETAHGRRFLQSRLFPEKDASGKVRFILGITTDLTEQRKAQDALQQSQERLGEELASMQRLHELMSRLLVSNDLQAALEEVLDAAIDITGATMGSIQMWDAEKAALEIGAQRGFKEDFLDYFKSVAIDDASTGARALQQGGRVVVEDVEADPEYASHREIAASAGYRAVQATPLLSRDGERLGVLSTYYCEPSRPSERDVRTLDLYARQATDFIEHVRNREAAKLASRRKDEFLATLAHELRNPLAPIVTGLEIMKRAGGERESFDEVRRMMERQSKQLVSLVDDLLDMSRVTRGKLELKRCPVLLAEIVRSAVEGSRPFIDEAGHELTVSLPEESIELFADPHRLAQVVSNLLNNAAKYTPDCGKIRLSAERIGDQLELSVNDTGIGLPTEMLEDVFEMYAQIEREPKKGAAGLGIGLTLVRLLVEMHGGTVGVRSEGVDRGSTFTIRLPVAGVPPQPEREAPPAAAAGVAPVASRRVLVVDDNEAAAKTLSMIVTMFGHEVRTAADGEQAVDAASEFRPDVILMDLGMPKMDGFQAARAIRQQPWGQDMRLVALSGWGMEEDRQRSREAGFDQHLVKPAELEMVRELLASAPRGPEPGSQ